jgi:hypothetical protein
MNIGTGVIRELVNGALKEHEMLLPIEGPLSEKALRDKTPLDRLRILRAQDKRARRRTRNLKGN